MIYSILVALAITVGNTAAALAVIFYVSKRKPEQTSKYVFASMTVRYVLSAVAIWLCLSMLDLDRLAFGLTYLISTFVLIMSEILFLNYKSKLVNLRSNSIK